MSRQRSDRIAAVGAAAVDPARSSPIAIDMAGLVVASLAGPDEQMPVVDRHRHDIDGMAGLPPVRSTLAGSGIDAPNWIFRKFDWLFVVPAPSTHQLSPRRA